MPIVINNIILIILCSQICKGSGAVPGHVTISMCMYLYLLPTFVQVVFGSLISQELYENDR